MTPTKACWSRSAAAIDATVLQSNTETPLGPQNCQVGFRVEGVGPYWVAVKELKLSYYIAGTLLFTIYTHYGNLI